MEKAIQIVICGGGNGAHASAAYIGSKGQFIVNVLTRRPQDWKKQILLTNKGTAWEHRGDLFGNIDKISSDPRDFGTNVKIWLICGPAHIHGKLLDRIAPYVQPDSYVGTLFGQGGWDWLCKFTFGERLQKENITIFGLFNIPWICKIVDYGEKVRTIGPKLELQVAVEPKEKSLIIREVIEQMFDMPTYILPNFITLTLTPSNQIIHPGRIYGVFKDWDGKKAFNPKDIPLFYEDMDDFSAEVLQKLDDEIQAIKNKILQLFPGTDLSYVQPLKDRIKRQYGDQVKDDTNIKTTFTTNLGYTTVQIPVKNVEGGVIPNVDGRIFWEDIPYGLCILHDLGKMIDVKTPCCDDMIRWHQKFMGGKIFLLENGELNPDVIVETGTPTRYGFKCIKSALGIDVIKPKL